MVRKEGGWVALGGLGVKIGECSGQDTRIETDLASQVDRSCWVAIRGLRSDLRVVVSRRGGAFCLMRVFCVCC